MAASTTVAKKSAHVAGPRKSVDKTSSKKRKKADKSDAEKQKKKKAKETQPEEDVSEEEEAAAEEEEGEEEQAGENGAEEEAAGEEEEENADSMTDEQRNERGKCAAASMPLLARLPRCGKGCRIDARRSSERVQPASSPHGALSPDRHRQRDAPAHIDELKGVKTSCQVPRRPSLPSAPRRRTLARQRRDPQCVQRRSVHCPADSPDQRLPRCPGCTRV